MNVLKKIVIPRTNITIGYILTELEEMAREEFHRLKKVKEKKKRDSDERESRNKKEKPAHMTSNICEICKMDKNYKESESDLSAMTSTITLKPETEMISEFQKTSIPSSSRPLQSYINFENKLKYLKDNINNIIVQAKEFLNKTINSFDTNEFLTMCQKAKLDLEQLLAPVDYPKLENKRLERKLEHLKCHLREIIDIITEIKQEEVLSTSVKDFIHTCGAVDDKLNINIQAQELELRSNRIRLIELKDILKGVEKITETYKKQDLLSPSVEFFIEACNQMQLKLDQYSDTNSNDNIKISNHSKESEDFKVDTRNFNACAICKSTGEYIDKNLDTQGKPDNFISNVNDFVKSSKEVEDCFKSKTPKELQDLHSNLEEIIKIIMKQKEGEILSQSSEDSTKSFNEINNVNCNQNKTLRNKEESLEPPCTSACMMDVNLQEKNLIEKQQTLREKTLIDAPCNLCNELTNLKEPSNTSVCTYCTHPSENVPTSSKVTEIPSKSQRKSDERACSLCKKPIKLNTKSQVTETHDNVTTSSESSNCKYFKKEFKKKTKVKRKLKTDGSKWEQRKVTTIKRKKQDSKESSLSDNDDSDDTCEDSFDDDDVKQINICLITNNIEHGFANFLRLSQSEVLYKDTTISYPCVKYCLSVDKLICNTHILYSSSSSCSSVTEL